MEFGLYSASTRMWPMPNVMATLPNIVGALCPTPQSLADARCRAVKLPRRETR